LILLHTLNYTCDYASELKWRKFGGFFFNWIENNYKTTNTVLLITLIQVGISGNYIIKWTEPTLKNKPYYLWSLNKTIINVGIIVWITFLGSTSLSFHIYGNVSPLCPLTLTNVQALYISGPNILFKRVKMWKYLHYVVFKDVTLLLLLFFLMKLLYFIYDVWTQWSTSFRVRIIQSVSSRS